MLQVIEVDGGRSQLELSRKRNADGLSGDQALEAPSGIMVAMDDKPLLPGQWIDDLEWDALHTEADVEDVMGRVKLLKARLLAGAIRSAAQN